MPHYLVQVGYNTAGLAGLVKEPQDRIEKVTPAIEALGGRVECAYYAFGEHDIVLICEMPDNATAAAFALAVGLQLLVDSLVGEPGYGAVLLVARPEGDPLPGLRARAGGLRLPGDR